jgi:Flp pilus assembly protein TadG
MRTKTVSFLRGVFKGQSGQSIMWVAGLMLGLCGVAGLTIDVGHGYVVRNQLQNTVNSAGLAAAGYIYDNATGTLTTAESVANTYITDNPINNATTVFGLSDNDSRLPQRGTDGGLDVYDQPYQ